MPTSRSLTTCQTVSCPNSRLTNLSGGSVIPATLITGINSDVPGRITAQVRQNVFDSATGHRLLISQGKNLFGRYGSKVSFGQSRVLVVWTDIIFRTARLCRSAACPGQMRKGMAGSATR